MTMLPRRARTRIATLGTLVSLLLLVVFALAVRALAAGIMQADLDDELDTLSVAIGSDLELNGLGEVSHEALRAGVEANALVYRLEHHSAVLFDRNEVLAASGDLGRHVSFSEVSRFLSHREGFFTEREPFSSAHRICRFRVNHLGGRAAGTTLLLFRPIEAIERAGRRLDAALALLVVSGFVITAVVLFAAVGRALEPVERITRFTGELTPADLSQRVTVTAAGEEFRRLSQVINSLLERIETAFVAQRRLVADAAHELKTPVAVIAAEAQDLARGRIEPAAAPASLTMISDTARSLAREIDDLLELARGDAAAAESREPLDLRDVVATAVASIAPLATARGGRIDPMLPATALPFAGDRQRLTRSIANLLSNAVRYAPDGSSVDVEAGRDGDEHFVRVADRGPGIPDADRARIFERFVRLASARSAHPEGSGLGLAIVEQAVRAHGGRIEVRARDGGGAIFEIRLPAV
jgi:signal transduction histidine kinase